MRMYDVYEEVAVELVAVAFSAVAADGESTCAARDAGVVSVGLGVSAEDEVVASCSSSSSSFMISVHRRVNYTCRRQSRASRSVGA